MTLLYMDMRTGFTAAFQVSSHQRIASPMVANMVMKAVMSAAPLSMLNAPRGQLGGNSDFSRLFDEESRPAILVRCVWVISGLGCW
jgi:hypothetical protein